MFNKEDILNTVKDLENKLGSKLVIDFGAALVVHGISDYTNDIDLHVTDINIWNKLLNEYKDNVNIYSDNRPIIKYNNSIELGFIKDNLDIIDVNGFKITSIYSLYNTYKEFNREKDKDKINKLKELI